MKILVIAHNEVKANEAEKAILAVDDKLKVKKVYLGAKSVPRHFEAVVSPALLAEYHETIEELHREYPNRSTVAWAEALTDTAALVFPAERAAGATPDPHDEMILSIICTGDNIIVIRFIFVTHLYIYIHQYHR